MELWSVGVVDAPIQSFLDEGQPEVRFIEHPNRLSLADPFGVEREGGVTFLCEELDADVRPHIGRVVAIDFEDEGSFSITPAIERDYSVTYPYLMHHEGDVYMVPETYQAGEVKLFKATSFPTAWEEVEVMLPIAGVDCTIFHHDGRWWMLGADYAEGSNDKLFAWYSDNRFGPWTPHPGNPVKLSSASSRPAGTPFVHDGGLYRPSQDCSITYGGRVVISRIVELTPMAFKEEPVTTVEPIPGSPISGGVHTISACGGRTLIDGKSG
jgi:hypothetical protein